MDDWLLPASLPALEYRLEISMSLPTFGNFPEN